MATVTNKTPKMMRLFMFIVYRETDFDDFS